MSSEIEELIGLLSESNLHADVRIKVWECILGLTATKEGLNSLLTKKHVAFIQSCLKNCKENDSLSLVYKCLINMSSTEEGTLKLLTYYENFVGDLILSIRNPSFTFIESACHILNNLTSHQSFFSQDNLQKFTPEQLEALMKCFLSLDKEIREKYRFLALVFANITKHNEGRKYFLENYDLLSDIFRINADPYESEIRRLGISLTTANCCFETEFHPKLRELNILPNLLLPLMGPEDYNEEEMEKFPIECQYLEADKKREENPKIRKTLVQALSLMCYTEDAWNYLKDNGVYYIIKELHNWEKDEDVNEAIETLILYMLVENYQLADKNKESILNPEVVKPLETDFVKDLPDFVINLNS